MRPRRHVFISVAGVMGTGKTTACKLLSDRLGLELVEENVDGNMFIPLFYKNPRRWAFASQLFYLSEKEAQIDKVKKLLRRSGVVQDTPVFIDFHMYVKAHRALGTMTEHEYLLYEHYFNRVAKRLPIPDLIVHLDVPPHVIAQRIHARGRRYEKKVDISYIELLSKFQDTWIRQHTISPILTVNTGKLDLASNARHQDKFVTLVTGAIAKVPA